MKNISFEQVNINGGFWSAKQHMLLTTAESVYERFKETYRFEAMDVKGWLNRLLQEEQTNHPDALISPDDPAQSIHQDEPPLTASALQNSGAPSTDRPRIGHIFWDSDIAKWIEGTAYLLEIAKEWKNSADHTEVEIQKLGLLEQICDETIDTICKNADENGYFNSHFQVTEALHEANRFTDRSQHELYCAGHLIEAAIAYKRATGKTKLLDLMIRYADYIDRIFRVENAAAFVTPGHPELELSLVKLSKETGEKRYLE
ncbi:MAG: glycoside hydrolase family 127 protein, partial [Firmicutes bacterium]|nr:glycoside hydrolase family 127 protein [Bacillota bacterium]